MLYASGISIYIYMGTYVISISMWFVTFHPMTELVSNIYCTTGSTTYNMVMAILPPSYTYTLITWVIAGL